MVRVVFRHFAAASTRVSPDFALLRHISRFFRVLTQTFTSRTQTTHKITVGCRCMCACVCTCVCGKTLKEPRNNPEHGQSWTIKQGQNMVKEVAIKNSKNKKHGKCVTTRTPFLARYGHPRTPKTVQKKVIFPYALFLHFSCDLQTFSDLRSYPKRPN